MERLEYLLSLLNQYESDETGFKVIYRELIAEINKQREIDSNRRTNSYLNNLEQTWGKELMSYVRAKLKKSDSSNYNWRYFVSAFKQDIKDVLSMIR